MNEEGMAMLDWPWSIYAADLKGERQAPPQRQKTEEDAEEREAPDKTRPQLPQATQRNS